MSGTVGIIGVGHLAGYLVEGLAASADAPAMLLSPRNRTMAKDLAHRFGCRVAADNAAVVAASDIVILATRPADSVTAIGGLPWRPGQPLVSVAAGVPAGRLSAAAPGATVVRALPVASSAAGASPTPLWPDHAAVRSLLGRLGSVVPLPDESTFDAATTLGAFYAWLHALMAEVEAWCLARGVPPEQTRTLVAGCLTGAAAMASRDPAVPLPAMLTTLATPGGISAAGLSVLETGTGLSDWRTALDAAALRLRKVRDD